MVMALKMIIHPKTHHFMVISGYEGGHTIVHLEPTSHQDYGCGKNPP